MTGRFRDRAEAGRQLAARLAYLDATGVVVLGLPRGGIPVAFEVAAALRVPLDVIVVRKLGVPYQLELGMGAVGEDGARVLNDEVVRMARVSEEEIAEAERRERAEVERRATRYRGGRGRVPLDGRIAVVVDDGIATGSTARVACQVARAHGASRVVLAVPVAPRQAVTSFADVADEVVCLRSPEQFYAVGEYYDDFSQTNDAEVEALLARSASWSSAASSPAHDPLVATEDATHTVTLRLATGPPSSAASGHPSDARELPGCQVVPPECRCPVRGFEGVTAPPA